MLTAVTFEFDLGRVREDRWCIFQVLLTDIKELKNMNPDNIFYHKHYVRKPDKEFASFDDLYTHAYREEQSSSTKWVPPSDVYATVHQGLLKLKLTGDRAFALNDWSYYQLCSLLNVDRQIIEQLKLETAAQVISELIPRDNRPLQVFTVGDTIRSIHSISYERLFNSRLLEVVIDEVTNMTEFDDKQFRAPAFFAGECDLFAYMIDESNWLNYRDERFAPAFVVWNSEVGARSIGMHSCWFHAQSGAFLIDDGEDPIAYVRRHSSGVHESLRVIRGRIHLWLATVETRSQRFLRLLSVAAGTEFTTPIDTYSKRLVRHGISREVVKKLELNRPSAGRQLSRLDVALDSLSTVRFAQSASSRFELGVFLASLVLAKSEVRSVAQVLPLMLSSSK